MPTETKKLDKTCASFLWEKNGTWDFAQPVVANQRSTEYTSDGVHYSTDVAPILKWINICTTIIGSLGLIANITAIVILLLIKSGRLFNRDRSGQNPTQVCFAQPEQFFGGHEPTCSIFFLTRGNFCLTRAI